MINSLNSIQKTVRSPEQSILRLKYRRSLYLTDLNQKVIPTQKIEPKRLKMEHIVAEENIESGEIFRIEDGYAILCTKDDFDYPAEVLAMALQPAKQDQPVQYVPLLDLPPMRIEDLLSPSKTR